LRIIMGAQLVPDWNKCTQEYEDGSVFHGQCRDGRFHGKGTFKFGPFNHQPLPHNIENGTYEGGTYEGYFEDGCLHGQGIYRYHDGGRYQGQFKYSMRDGYGVFTWPNGELYEGRWEKDHPEGDGRVIHPSGELVTTTFSAGEQDFDDDRWRKRRQVNKIAQAIEDNTGRKGAAGAIALIAETPQVKCNGAEQAGMTQALDEAIARPAQKGENMEQYKAVQDAANRHLEAIGATPANRMLPPPPPPPLGIGDTIVGAQKGPPSATGRLSAPALPALPPFPAKSGHRGPAPLAGGGGAGLAMIQAQAGGVGPNSRLPVLPPMAPYARPPPAPPAPPKENKSRFKLKDKAPQDSQGPLALGNG
jgi:hypothetical protein